MLTHEATGMIEEIKESRETTWILFPTDKEILQFVQEKKHQQ